MSGELLEASKFYRKETKDTDQDPPNFIWAKIGKVTLDIAEAKCNVCQHVNQLVGRGASLLRKQKEGIRVKCSGCGANLDLKHSRVLSPAKMNNKKLILK